jgi:succinate dehydrogenase/fumarate reductase flavoprotein subunit
VPGLLAAGEVAFCGLVGDEYPCCGTAIGTGLCFGRLAGANAAAYEQLRNKTEKRKKKERRAPSNTARGACFVEFGPGVSLCIQRRTGRQRPLFAAQK